MSAHPLNKNDFTVAVFPFLKTRERVHIGRLQFRSTDDTTGLPAGQVQAIEEIRSMLFLQDSLRITSASFAITPRIDLTYQTFDAGDLIDIQAVVAYFYASPRHSFGDLFLAPEHASLAVFTPEHLFTSLIRPDFHVEEEAPTVPLKGDNLDKVRGYAGVYNFRHPFWVAKGSRLYGPMPHMTLNQSQDLSHQIGTLPSRLDYALLLELLRKEESTSAKKRALNAVRWFNAANSAANDDATAIMKLAVAFESLLNLPAGEKTDRLIDSISLLLGRPPRLDVWARQFYHARSCVVHEGSTQQVRFVATDSTRVTDGARYQSLFSYGRRIFQLCVGALLAGAELAEQAHLADTLVTNEERFQAICETLVDEKVTASERLASVLPQVVAIEEYRYVPETGLKIATMVGATRLIAKAGLASALSMSQEFRDALEGLVNARRSDTHLDELDAINGLYELLRGPQRASLISDLESVVRLIDVVHTYTAMHHYWLKEKAKTAPP
jgi:Apea-like HEPN